MSSNRSGVFGLTDRVAACEAVSRGDGTSTPINASCKAWTLWGWFDEARSVEIELLSVAVSLFAPVGVFASVWDPGVGVDSLKS